MHRKSIRTKAWELYYQGYLSRTMSIHRTEREERDHFFILFYHFHLLMSLQTFICNFVCEMTMSYFYHISIATLVFTRLLLDGIYHLIGNYHLTDWWCDVNFCFFTWWFHSRFSLQQFDAGNRWARTRIGYHSFVTGERTNQVC